MQLHFKKLYYVDLLAKVSSVVLFLMMQFVEKQHYHNSTFKALILYNVEVQ